MSETFGVQMLKPNQLTYAYLNHLTADVLFACGPDDCTSPEMVPAHKIILSSCSAVFKTMFYGSLPEKPIIRITDATGDGFKEFLQFFYLEKVNATVEYAAEVIYLSKKYELTEYLNVYAKFLQRQLKIDQICQGLELAIRFDLSSLKEFCEFVITKNHVKLFESKGFLSCGQNVLKSILQLEELKLHSEEVFVGCFRWARNALKRQNGNDSEPTFSEIRKQMNDYFDLIEFGSMKCQAITMILYEFNGLFTAEDLALIYTILVTKFPVNLGSHKVGECHLKSAQSDSTKHYIDEDNVITFHTNAKVYMVGYKNARILQEGWVVQHPLWLVLIKKASNLDQKDIVLLRQKFNTGIPFTSKNKKFYEEEKAIEPIMIEPNVKYAIRIKSVNQSASKHYTEQLFESSVCHLGITETVSIEGSSSAISCLQFKS